jgi:Zn-dependent M28 family amino/carboxypeptidase
MLLPDISGLNGGLAERLRQTVDRLTQIGPRNIYHYGALEQAVEFCSSRLRIAGRNPALQPYEARGKTFANIVAEFPGHTRPNEIAVAGAHYDTHKNSPGANDNGSGLAVLFDLAQTCVEHQTARTLRFVAFTNEESPFTRTKQMGSRVYASECRQRGDNIVAMLCLETLQESSNNAEFGSRPN